MDVIYVKTKTGSGLHMRKSHIRSKTVCGRAIPKTWKDTDEVRSDAVCAQCEVVAERFVDHENVTGDDFSPVYDAL